MSRKILIIAFVFVFLTLLLELGFEHFYLRPLKAEAKIEFNKDKKEITIFFKYPLSKEYFLKNFKIIPATEGNYIFDEYKSPILFRKVHFVPEKLEKDKNYKVKTFEKEFSFSLPSPKPKEIAFDEAKKEIEISFFEPIEENYFFGKLNFSECDAEKCVVIPRETGDYIFLDANKKVIFRPEKIDEDKDYKIGILDKELSFKIESPKVKEIYFDKEKNETFITFSKKIEAERFFENFKFYQCKKSECGIISQKTGEFLFSDSGDKVTFKPSLLEEGRNYKVEVLGESLAFEIPLPENESKPQVKPAPQPQQNVESAMTSQEKLIEVDLSEQRLKLHQDGEVIAEYIISSGKSGMRTPAGDYSVLSKEENHWSSTYALWMPYSLRFYNGFYIHELPYWPGGYREGEEHLGIPVSHGCVRLGIGSANTVYDFSEVGTKITIHN